MSHLVALLIILVMNALVLMPCYVWNLEWISLPVRYFMPLVILHVFPPHGFSSKYALSSLLHHLCLLSTLKTTVRCTYCGNGIRDLPIHLALKSGSRMGKPGSTAPMTQSDMAV